MSSSARCSISKTAQREARKEARKELRHEREKKHKAGVEAKVAELKAKLPGHHGNVPAGTPG